MKQEIVSLKKFHQSELIKKKHKKVSTTLNYIDHFLILVSAFTACIPISSFVSLLGILIVITSSGMELKICATSAGIKDHK